MSRVIAVHDLTKHYGQTVAVDGLSFDAPPGQVTGFLGPNGAGSVKHPAQLPQTPEWR